MSRMSLPQRFENWIRRSAMTEAEKSDCCFRMREGFSQDADLLLLGASEKAEREILRAMGLGPARRKTIYHLQNWRIWRCPHPSKQPDLLKHFLQSENPDGRKKLILLLAPVGGGSRIRARRAWKQAGINAARIVPEPSLLAVQISLKPGRALYVRHESEEALLQQTVFDCLQRQVPVLTVCTGRQSGYGKEQLWYQMAKIL